MSPWSWSDPTASGNPRGGTVPTSPCPGRQRELVEAVVEANPRTVVIVNAGSPVEMPWATRAGAVLLPWYGGEEAADALADIIVGAAEPSGRLPITFPLRAEDGPTGGNPELYPGLEGRVALRGGRVGRVSLL